MGVRGFVWGECHFGETAIIGYIYYLNITYHLMDNNLQEIAELKENILKAANIDKQNLVDRLIELQGMASMEFFQGIFLMDPLQTKEGTAKLKDVAGYGVRQLIILQAILSKSEFKFCPFCKLGLKEYELIDPYLVGLKCENHHYFHIEMIKDGCFDDKSLQSDKTTSLEIAKDWLTDKNLRKQLQNQLAEVLRKYVNMQASVTVDEENHDVFNFCPICGFPLEKFEQDDVWVEGLECPNKHVFYSRNGLSHNLTNLQPDITKKDFDFLLEGYLEEDQREYLPEQIIKLLTEMKS